MEFLLHSWQTTCTECNGFHWKNHSVLQLRLLTVCVDDPEHRESERWYTGQKALYAHGEILKVANAPLFICLILSYLYWLNDYIKKRSR